jgi:hypothetical protein
LLWSKVVDLISKKEHLTEKGFYSILTYYVSINKGISSSVSAAFPGVIGIQKESFNLPDSLNPYWVSGFVAGDGGFSIGIRSEKGQIYFRFHVTQHSRDLSLMKLFINFFDCGKVNLRSKTNRCDYYVQDYLQIFNNIIPHFDKYPLCNAKSLDYSDFKKALELYKDRGRNKTDEIK